MHKQRTHQQTLRSQTFISVTLRGVDSTAYPTTTLDQFGATIPTNLSSAAIACETDRDGIIDALDNCPSVPNPGQENNDAAPAWPWVAEGVAALGVPPGADACHPDDDNDGCPDARKYVGDPNSVGDRDPLLPWDFSTCPYPHCAQRTRVAR